MPTEAIAVAIATAFFAGVCAGFGIAIPRIRELKARLTVYRRAIKGEQVARPDAAERRREREDAKKRQRAKKRRRGK